MGKKQDVLGRLFRICQARGDLVFDNDLVKEVCQEIGFKNPFDATKVDRTDLYPDVMQQGGGYFVIHLGEGRHQFVPNQALAYHQFEVIEPHESVAWRYRQSLLNEYDTSESNIISVGLNQRILHDFLYDDIVANPKWYGSRRTKFTGRYTIASQGIHVRKLQMEIDAVLELDNVVTIVEGKNGFPEDFAVYQLFHPYLYFEDIRQRGKLLIEGIQCCYLQRLRDATGSTLRLYLYRFHDSELSSIELIRKREYVLEVKGSR